MRGNQLAANRINGMEVRGGVITTETVWDDTDIVHVLQSEINVPNHHHVGGLRLVSRVDESLVVKLQGPTAGFTAVVARWTSPIVLAEPSKSKVPQVSQSY